MDLNLEEQRLIAEFRNLSPSEQGDLMSYAASLGRRRAEAGGGQGGQCHLKQGAARPEADKSPIFTE